MIDWFLHHGLPFILSAITLFQLFLAGSLHRNAWAVALGNQLLWLIWIIATGTWGLLPMNVGMWIVCYRNHVKWWRR